MTKLATELAVDDPIELNARSRFGNPERRHIDDQIRTIQQLILDAVLDGKHGSWFTLSANSVPVLPGDTVCLAGEDGMVTKATAGPLTTAKAGVGVVNYAASPGARVLVVFGGLLPPTTTGLGAASGFARINPSTSRLERVAALNPESDFGMGIVDAGGYLQVLPGVLGAFGDSGGSGNPLYASLFTWSPSAYPKAQSTSYQATHLASSSSIATALDIPLADDRATDIAATVLGRKSGKHFALDLRAGYEATGGVYTTTRAPTAASPGDVNPVGWDAVIDRSGSNARVRITAESGAIFSVVANCQIVSLDDITVVSGDPAPTVTSVSPTSGPATTATAMTVTGTNFVNGGGLGVKVNGVACTSVVWVSATSITCVTPASAAGGPYTVQVTNPDTQTGSLVSAYEFEAGEIDPDSLALSGNWYDFAATPWEGIASAGASLGRDLINGAAPTVGANFGSHPSASFDGTQYLQQALTVDSFLSPDEYTIEVICEAASLATAQTEPYEEPLLFGDNNGNLYLAISAAGVRIGHHDGGGGDWTPYAAVPATGTKMCIQAVYNGTTAKVRVNGGTWQSVARATAVNMDAGTPRVGVNYASNKFFTGKMARIHTSLVAESDSTLDGTYAHAQTNFGVA